MWILLLDVDFPIMLQSAPLIVARTCIADMKIKISYIDLPYKQFLVVLFQVAQRVSAIKAQKF